MCANNILFLGKIKYCNHCGQKRSPQNWVQHLSSSPFGLLGNRKGENWRNPASSRFSENGTSRASSWFDLSAIFQIVWLRSIVRGRLKLNASGTIFYVYILFFTEYIVFFNTTVLLSLLFSSSWYFFLFRIYGVWKIQSWSPNDYRCETYRGHLRTLGSCICRWNRTSWWRRNSKDCEAGVLWPYMSHFEDEGLSFPLPHFLLEALVELAMDFT